AVVIRDRRLDWGVLAQQPRQGFDALEAFNVWLAQQLPVLAGAVASAAIVARAEEFYAQAARHTVAASTSKDAAASDRLRALLRTCDNDAEQLAQLLAALLPRRDQWLRHFA